MRDWNSLHSTSLRFFSMIMGFYDLWFNCCCFICLYLLLRIVFMFIFFLRRKHKLIVIFVLRVHCSFNNWNDKAITCQAIKLSHIEQVLHMSYMTTELIVASSANLTGFILSGYSFLVWRMLRMWWGNYNKSDEANTFLNCTIFLVNLWYMINVESSSRVCGPFIYRFGWPWLLPNERLKTIYVLRS